MEPPTRPAAAACSNGRGHGRGESAKPFSRSAATGRSVALTICAPALRDFIPGDATIDAAQEAGGSATGGGQCLEAQAGQRTRRTAVPGIGNHEGLRTPMQFPQQLTLMLLLDHRSSSSLLRLSANCQARHSPLEPIRGHPQALPDASLSGAACAAHAGWRIQQPPAAGMPAAAPGGYRRAALVGKELPGRIHFVQFGEPHASGLADVRRVATPASTRTCASFARSLEFDLDRRAAGDDRLLGQHHAPRRCTDCICIRSASISGTYYVRTPAAARD